MEIYFIIVFFIIGMVLGSFYNVVGYRLPKGESIVFPPSHCPNCNHQLKNLELIPIFSFLIQGGKCTNCKKKISWFYPIFEFSSGFLFALSYFIFGFTGQLVIALIFISMTLIVVLTDYYYMIILDEVLLVAILLFVFAIFFTYGSKALLFSFLEGLIAFIIMFIIKKIGDFIFKKESMGGGDIKLMFIFGLVLGWKAAVLSIFLGSFIGFPISLLFLYKKNSNIIPFGPFLSLGAVIILLTKIDFNWIVRLISK